MSLQSESLQLQSIGILKSLQDYKYQLPHQPDGEQIIQGVVELRQGHNYDVGLRDLVGFDRIWLLWWFHRNKNWRPTTLPPQGRTGRKGVFSTRSPYRPNPLAVSCVELIKIEGHKLYVGPHDLLSHTPILDIKPYLPDFDSFPDSQCGWYDDMKSDLASNTPWTVSFNPETESFLQNEENFSSPIEGRALRAKVEKTLSLDPHPHRTRRIARFQDAYRMSCGDWRVFFQIEDPNEVQVFRVEKRA